MTVATIYHLTLFKIHTHNFSLHLFFFFFLQLVQAQILVQQVATAALF